MKRLVDEFDAATHVDRVRRMAVLGRDEAGSAQLTTLLDSLQQRSSYEHFLALVAAVAAGDVDRVIEATSSPVASVRSFGFSHLLSVGAPDEVIVRTVVAGSAVDRAQVLKVISRTQQRALAEQLVDDLRDRRGDREAAALLPACSPETVTRLLPALDFAVRNWSSLARRHPGPVLAHFEERLRAATPHRRDQLWRMWGPGVVAALPADETRVLAILDQIGPSWGAAVVVHRHLAGLTRRHPDWVGRALLDPAFRSTLIRGGLPHGIRRHVRSLSETTRLELARVLRDSPVQLAAYLRCFAPSDRTVVFRASFADIDTSQVIWTDVLMDVLPAGPRVTEARRILNLRTIRDNPQAKLSFTAYLPIDEAREVLESATRRARPEDRSAGFVALIACSRRSRSVDEVGATLAYIAARLRNEQDPVRLAACAAISAVPAHLVTGQHVRSLTDLITSVVDARDTSPGTIQFLNRFVLRLLEANAVEPNGAAFAFALGALDRLAGPSGTISFGQLDHLRRGAEAALLDTLLPRLRREADHDSFDLALALATALRRRAWDLDDLQALIGRATRAPLDRVVRRAITLWLEPPATRRTRVDVIVHQDPSTMTLQPVLDAISLQRQDLLDKLLGTKRPLRGRFLTGDVRFVPIIGRGVNRWLPRQHISYAAALNQLINSSATKTWTVAAAIRALARLPDLGVTALEPHLASADVVRVEAALGGLAWTDTPQHAVARLAQFAGDDRARVAIYAITRCSRFVPPADLASPLAAILQSPSSKVTSRKEAIRLIAHHRPPGAFDQLASLSTDQGLHRDIRIALGRAMREFLEDVQAWTLLEGLSVSGRDEARSLLETHPDQIADVHRTRFAVLVLSLAGHPDPVVRQEAFVALPDWAPWAPTAAAAAAAHVADLESGSSWRYAVQALTLLFRDGLAGTTTRGLLNALASISPNDAPPDRDLPARQRLEVLVHGIVGLPARDRDRLRDDLMLCVGALASQPTLLSHRVSLLLAVADWTNAVPVLVAIAEQLLTRPGSIDGAAHGLRAALDRDQATWTSDQLETVADHLSRRAEPAFLALALAVITTAGVRAGWPDQWRERLDGLRVIDNPDIAEAARDVHYVAE